jgi:hypothetical protein
VKHALDINTPVFSSHSTRYDIFYFMNANRARALHVILDPISSYSHKIRKKEKKKPLKVREKQKHKCRKDFLRVNE